MAPPLVLTNAARSIHATDADLSGSRFVDVRLGQLTVRNADLSGAVFENVTMAGAHLTDIDLGGLQLSKADLRGATLTDCALDGMTIDGVAVSAMMAAYRAEIG